MPFKEKFAEFLAQIIKFGKTIINAPLMPVSGAAVRQMVSSYNDIFLNLTQQKIEILENEISMYKACIAKNKKWSIVYVILILLLIACLFVNHKKTVSEINPSAPAIAENNAAACPAAVSVISKKADRFPRFAPVHFAWNAYAITQEHKKTMSPLVDYMIQNPDKSLVIYGNADGIGSIGNNVIIGERRLSAVKSYLVENGIDAGRIRTVNNGEDKTERTNKMPFGRYLNRRVDFEIKEYSKQELTAIRIENYFNQNKIGFPDMKVNIWEDTTVYLSPISIFEKQYVIDIYVLAEDIKINFFDRYDEKMSSSREELIDKLIQHGFAEASRGYSKTINSTDFEENSDSELKTVIESLLSDLSEFGKK